MSQKLRINVHVNTSEVLETDQNISLNVQNNARYVLVLFCRMMGHMTVSQFFSSIMYYIFNAGCTL